MTCVGRQHQTALSEARNRVMHQHCPVLRSSHTFADTCLMCVRSYRQAKSPSQAKVSKLQRIAFPVDQQILWLQVPVQNPAWQHADV